MIVGAFTSAFWRRLCAALEHEEWITDPRFATNDARVANRGTLIPAIEEIFGRQPREHWDQLLGRFDVPCTPVNSVAAALRSGQAAASGLTHALHSEGDAPVHVVASPIRAKAWPAAPHRVAPRLGADTERVLGGLLSLPPSEIEDLVARGVVGLEESDV
jgi:crotonobetainyl-CoA:carnitine CoA-transferase CaiB-like acyl-CoA transferase